MQKLYSLTRYFILVIILSNLSSRASAQHNKFTGFFISIQGDTIQGSFPRYKQWNYNPEKVVFISVQSRKQEILTPSTCKEFHINKYETYIAFHGKRMANPMVYFQSNPADRPDIYDTITTFLREVAVTDSCRFYIFNDKVRFNLYYSTTTGIITELLQKVYVADNHIIQSMTYKKQLRALFPDKTRIVNRLLYSEEDLVALIGKQEKILSPSRIEKKRKGGFYISGGVSLNSLKFSPKVSLDFSEKDYDSHSIPLLAIGYIIPFSRNFSRAFFLPQMKISTLSHTSQAVYNDAYPDHSTTFRSSPVITLGFNFGYNIIDRPDLKLSLAPGAGFNFLMKPQQIDKYNFSSANASTIVTEMDHLQPMVDLQATVIVKKRYIIWSAYNFPSHVTIYRAVKDKFTSKQLGVGYKF